MQTKVLGHSDWDSNIVSISIVVRVKPSFSYCKHVSFQTSSLLDISSYNPIMINDTFPSKGKIVQGNLKVSYSLFQSPNPNTFCCQSLLEIFADSLHHLKTSKVFQKRQKWLNLNINFVCGKLIFSSLLENKLFVS